MKFVSKLLFVAVINYYSYALKPPAVKYSEQAREFHNVLFLVNST